MKTDVKRVLAVNNRMLRKYPGKLLFGPTGARLWADYLDSAPGFSGRLDFIHKLNLPLLFTLRVRGRGIIMPGAQAVWYPDELRLRYECTSFRFSERKTITWQDEAISLTQWQNLSDEPLTLELVLPEGAREGHPYGFPVRLHGLDVVMLFCADDSLSSGTLTLMPGETRTLLCAAALGLKGEEEKLKERCGAILARAGDAEAFLDECCEEYLKWFEDAPKFECSDPYLTVCWWYRAYILRASLAEPAHGYLRHRLFYEGRDHRMDKTACAPSGWSFSRLIPLSTPQTLTDLRWIRCPETGKEAFRTLADSLNEDGAFSVSAVDSKGKEYCQYAAWALYGFYLLWNDKPFVKEVLPHFKRDCRSVFERHKGENDALQICCAHALTGKEYQPGFWYFASGGYPKKVRGTKEGYTPLKRVDSSVYMYLNCLALERLCREIGDADAEEFASRARAIKRDVLEKMWDEETGCFYDLHWQSDEKAFVRHVVGVYPLWAGMTEEKHLRQLDCMLSPETFARGSGFASVSADCPVYSPSGGWMGDYFKGGDGCMWNGPSWPYTTCIVLDALARQSKLHAHRYDGAFAKHLREYTLEHFRYGDLKQPYLVEHYDAETGQAISDEADYNHSFFLDLIVRHVCGLEIKEDGLLFEPLSVGLEYFSLKGVQLRGHTADVYYQQRESAPYDGFKAGYTLFLDGEKRIDGVSASDAHVFLKL